MPKIKKTEADHIQITRDALVKAELEFVAFDGWNLQRAIKNAGVDRELALVACPRGASDLARWYHIMGDRAMVEVLGANSNAVPVGTRAGVVFAVKTRLNLSAPLSSAPLIYPTERLYGAIWRCFLCRNTREWAASWFGKPPIKFGRVWAMNPKI